MKGFVLKGGKAVNITGNAYSESKKLAMLPSLDGFELVIYEVEKPVQGDDEDDEDFKVRLQKYEQNAKFTASVSADGEEFSCLFSRKFVSKKFGSNKDKDFDQFCKAFANPFGYKGTPKLAPLPKDTVLFVASAEDENGDFKRRKNGKIIAYRYTLGIPEEFKLEEPEVAEKKLAELEKLSAEAKPEQNSEPEEW